MDGGAWWAAVHEVAKSRTWLSDYTFTFHFHALEKEMATHSSVLAWRIPGTGEPGRRPSMGSHRVGHDWSDLAADCIGYYVKCCNEYQSLDISLRQWCYTFQNYTQIGWLDARVILFLIFEESPYCLPSGYTNQFTYQQCTSIPFSPHPHQQ